MGRELQKKKRRSGRTPVRQSNRTKKILNPRGNNIIAKNWNKEETLAQNYRRLGLLARLKAPTGGIEKKLKADTKSTTTTGTATTLRTSKSDPFAITAVEKAIVSEARVERDADGNITRILGGRAENPLNDPLNELESDNDEEFDNAVDEHGGAEEWGGINDDGEGTTDVVRSLIEEAKNPAPAKFRYLSEGEREWLEKLIAKHGDDTKAMARDFRLNPMQQTASDIAKRIKKLKA